VDNFDDKADVDKLPDSKEYYKCNIKDMRTSLGEAK
jgi:hypothetical protein